MKRDLINDMKADMKETKAKTTRSTKSKATKQLEKDIDKLIESKEEAAKPLPICVHVYLRLGTKKIIYRGFTSCDEVRAWFKAHVQYSRNVIKATDSIALQTVITADVILKPFDKKGANK